MAAYLNTSFIPNFEKFELVQIPRVENPQANVLSRLANNEDFELLKIVHIERLTKLSIAEGEEIMWIEGTHPRCSLL